MKTVFLTIITTLHMNLRLFLLMLLLGSSPLWAQTPVAKAAPAGKNAQDPLNKPKIWDKLKADPDDDNLWQAYFGKDLFNLSKEEMGNFKLWKQRLQDEFATNEATNESRKLNSRAEAQAAAYASEFKRLMENVNRNFMMIEEYFTEKFAQHGEKYITYREKYPDGKYNKTLWVEQQEKRLLELVRRQ